ncbi:MAG: RagB/SusD family nutrient uptake outer membrane protein [Bacteroidota bacterium]
MKSRIKYIWMLPLLFAMSLFNSCQDDFLDRYPLDSMTDATFFKSADDVKVMVNGFYRLFPRYHFQVGGSADQRYLDANTDIQVGTGPSGALMQRGSSGQAPSTSGTWNNNFDWIRQTNYVIENAGRVPVSKEKDQYVGEAYFFRAWVYFNMLTTYGDIPIYTDVLATDDIEKLYKPRDSRYDVAKFIIQDLDSAIVKLGWKNSDFSKEGRVNKESALTMKARVALYEGSWERYHGAKDTPFAVEGKDGNEFLQMVEPAILQLIDHQGASVFTDGGPFNEPYNQLESQMDASSTEGVFLYRAYDVNEITGHNFYGMVVYNNQSMTRKFVNKYLDKEGMPQELSSLPLDPESLNNLGENLDPRFRQTIWTPDRGPQDQIPGFGTQALPLRYPRITGVHDAINYTSTGLRRWKGAIFDENEWRNGSTDDVLMRYAEGLLALAEAKAMLGTIEQSDLDKTVNVLRARIGMAPMDLGTVQSWSISYSLEDGFEPSEPNIVNEIRRERVVELALEGHRERDLKRWGVYHHVINGWRPKGAHSQEFVDYFNNPSRLMADGLSEENANNWNLTLGENYDVHSDGFINPFHKDPQFDSSGAGYYVEPDRVYLSPIPKNQIDLYLNDAGVELTQNPGWF